MESSVSDIVRAIRDVSDDFEVGGSSMDTLDRWISRAAEDDFARFLLDTLQVLEDEDRPRGGSVVHENGFRKISLFKDPDSSMQLRLNFWPAGTIDASIHNHRWHFLSFVVRGSINHSIFEASRSDEPGALTMVELSDADANLKKTIGATTPVALREIHRTSLTKGGAYSLDLDALHTISTATGAVTLMVTGRPLRPFTQVVRTSPAAATRRRLTNDECVEHVQSYVGSASPRPTPPGSTCMDQ
jgi:hypothetical protein